MPIIIVIDLFLNTIIILIVKIIIIFGKQIRKTTKTTKNNKYAIEREREKINIINRCKVFERIFNVDVVVIS